ncbi:EamA family transporter [Nesterenkonia natronophila]
MALAARIRPRIRHSSVLRPLPGDGCWIPGTVAPFSMLVPVVGILLAWLVLGETPALGEILGGMLVLAGVFWANGRPLRLPPARPAP